MNFCLSQRHWYTTSTSETPPEQEAQKKKDTDRVVEAWNALQNYGVKAVSRLDSSSERYKMLQARLRQYGLENVLQAVENIKQSDFLRGHGRKGWMITFDWFVRPNNFPKVLEGNYENRSGENERGDRNVGTDGERAGQGEERDEISEMYEQFIQSRKMAEQYSQQDRENMPDMRG